MIVSLRRLGPGANGGRRYAVLLDGEKIGAIEQRPVAHTRALVRGTVRPTTSLMWHASQDDRFEPLAGRWPIRWRSVAAVVGAHMARPETDAEVQKLAHAAKVES
jgi:hypothetical protein